MRTQSVDSLIEKLKASEERYQSFIANSTEQIWCAEFDIPVPLDLPEMEQVEHILRHAYYSAGNEAFANAYGATAKEIAGWRVKRTLPASEPSTVEFMLAVIRSGYRFTNLESREVAKDGSERVMLNNLVGVIEDNKVRRVWGTARDITEYRTTEKSIELRSIAIETMRDGCTIVDAADEELPIVYSNQQFSKITGYSQSEISGRNCRFLQGPDTCPKTLDEIRKAILRKEPFSGEILNYRKDGTPFLNFLRITPVFQGEGEGVLTHYVGIQSDITARRRAEQLVEEKSRALETELLRGEKARAELEGLTERLIDAQESERRHLARELHDDLTQRLAALAFEADSSSDSVSAVDVLARISKELTELARTTQEFSRQLHPSIIEDLGLARALGSECRRFGDQTGIEVRLTSNDFDYTLPREASLCIYRIFQESLSNISKHAHATLVEIELSRDHRGTILRVQDNGVGFDPNTESRSHTLGLVSMAERARHCGGGLSIKSIPGSGTTTTLTLRNDPTPES